jgi:beta-glucosidase
VALIRAVVAANPRTVVALVTGSAVLISEWDRAVPAVVQSWYSGMEGGHGLADVLLGRVDATGRLPFSVPTHHSHLPPFDADSAAVTYDSWHGYWHLARNGTVPAYPFGFGLSYTTFVLESAEFHVVGTAVQVGASVRNTGPRDGTDVLQLYGRRLDSSRPERLVAFQRLELGAGAVGSVNLTIPTHAFAERDTEIHALVVRPGTYELRLARHATDAGISARARLG